MTPIIDPMIFYWIGVCESLGVFLTIIAALLLVSIVVIWICVGIAIDFCCYDKDDFELIAKAKKWSLILAIFGIIFGCAAAFAPSKETLYAMTVANYITEDNIDYITEKGEKGIQFIIEQIDTLLEDNKNEEND